MHVRHKNARYFVGRALDEETDRIATTEVFLNKPRNRRVALPAVHERPNMKASLRIYEMWPGRRRKWKLAILSGVAVRHEETCEEHSHVESREQDGAHHEFATIIHHLTPHEFVGLPRREAHLPRDCPRSGMQPTASQFRPLHKRPC